MTAMRASCPSPLLPRKQKSVEQHRPAEMTQTEFFVALHSVGRPDVLRRI
jgi:hypothetical protein